MFALIASECFVSFLAGQMLQFLANKGSHWLVEMLEEVATDLGVRLYKTVFKDQSDNMDRSCLAQHTDVTSFRSLPKAADIAAHSTACAAQFSSDLQRHMLVQIEELENLMMKKRKFKAIVSVTTIGYSPA